MTALYIARIFAFTSNLKLALTRDRVDESPKNVGLAGELVQLLWRKSSLLENTIESLELLGGIGVALGKLVKDLSIVLSVLVRCVLLVSKDSLLDLLGNIGKAGSSNVLRDERVECLNSASSEVKSTADSSVCARLLIDVGNQVGLGTTASVIYRRGRALGEELDGWI